MESVIIDTALPAPASAVWAAVQRREAFVQVAGAMLRCPAAERNPGPWRVGDRIAGWVLLFRVIPISRHTIEITSIDDVSMLMLTEERGGVIRVWKHYITVEPLGDNRCRYEDRIDIDAGGFTRLVATFTRVFFRYRQRRWGQLAVLLAASAEAALPR